MIYGKEVSDTGTPHLQGYVVFEKQKSLLAVSKLLPRSHLEAAKGTTAENVKYCSKSGDVVERGVRPRSPKEVGDSNKDKWHDVIKSAENGTVKELYPLEFVRYNGTLTRMYKPELNILETYSGIWYVGEPGTGKSRAAHENFPGAYKKMVNKWWDGYEDEKIVLLDDFSLNHHVLGYYLKIWTDHYPFRAESKGSSKMIRPETIVVTSNYYPEDIWREDPMLAKAINRRFKIVVFEDPFNINKYPDSFCATPYGMN